MLVVVHGISYCSLVEESKQQLKMAEELGKMTCTIVDRGLALNREERGVSKARRRDCCFYILLGWLEELAEAYWRKKEAESRVGLHGGGDGREREGGRASRERKE